VIKRLPAVRVAELTGVAESFEPRSITPVIGPLYEELLARLDRAGVALVGEGIAYYEDAPDGGVVVHAAIPVNVEPGGRDFAIVDLPEVERAATIVHRGPMEGVMPSVQRLARWIDDGGFRSAGYNRELYIQYGEGDPSAWTTELQEPLT
jgi:effector-binding domain-containing protein